MVEQIGAELERPHVGPIVDLAGGRIGRRVSRIDQLAVQRGGAVDEGDPVPDLEPSGGVQVLGRIVLVGVLEEQLAMGEIEIERRSPAAASNAEPWPDLADQVGVQVSIVIGQVGIFGIGLLNCRGGGDIPVSGQHRPVPGRQYEQDKYRRADRARHDRQSNPTDSWPTPRRRLSSRVVTVIPESISFANRVALIQ